MKVTHNQIKKLIKEELRKILSEGSGVIITNFDDDDEIMLPFTKDGEVLTTFSTSISELLYTHFPEIAESEYGEKLIDKSGDDLEDMLDGEAAIDFAQFVELMKALDPSFDVIRGHLKVADVGYTNIAVKLSPDGRSLMLDQDSDEAEITEDGDIKIYFGYTVTSDQLGELLRREADQHKSDRDYDGVYLSAYEEGESVYGGRDIPTSGHLRVNKLLEDINDGVLTITISDGEPPLFVVEKNRGL